MSGYLADMMCCANCGKVEVDDVKLKICTACRLVKYCSVECQKNHRPQHKKACKKKAAEIRDNRLFTQPDESYLGECPICCLPLSLDLRQSTRTSCCCTVICNGCDCAKKMREVEGGLEKRCAFCRDPLPKKDAGAQWKKKLAEKMKENYMERAKANDPAALSEIGRRCFNEGDYERSFEYCTKAAGLGDAMAHYLLSLLYADGKYVEKDLKKREYHLEEAAIGGHDKARCSLGIYEFNNQRFDRATKHFIIAAKLGDGDALERVKKSFQLGLVSKDDYEAALHGHQAAVDATKSEQRDAAYGFDNLSPEDQRRWLQRI